MSSDSPSSTSPPPAPSPSPSPNPNANPSLIHGPASVVSLPPHLRAALLAALTHLPVELGFTVAQHLQDGTGAPYNVLADVSRWARTNDIRTEFGLDPHDYTLVALLAGTRTSPNANFSVPSDGAAHRSDKQAITALINGLFSVIGVGVAGWWAASGAGWDNEVSVLFGLMAALIVAATEGSLYIMWQYRRDHAPKTRQVVRRIIVPDLPEVVVTPPTAVAEKPEEDLDSQLRQRRTRNANADTDEDAD
ncbi:hypothetical protein AURDEDRAFT_183771 [Auricularia subglabra TFB-10046 SS5]|nr:hypothetical protein AURDEDRAFT_183771 [Auricularia subglabra TFB-10046 SS5]